MTNISSKVTLILFALIEFHSTIRCQSALGQCKIHYEAETFNDTTYGLALLDKNENVLFDWPEIIGPVVVKKIDDESFELYCYANAIKIRNNDVTYKRVSFCRVKFGLNSCNIEKSITLKRVDTSMLIKNYECLKAKYSGTANDSTSQKVQLTLLQYSCDLMYGALMGSIKCKQLYYSFINDFQYMQFGLNGSDYISNREIVKRLTK